MKPLILPVFLLLCAPACAETPLSAEAFDRYTRGKTIFYAGNGARYGAEEYLDDRVVRWSFLDGECKMGQWYDAGPDICFEYEDNPEPQCWQFFLDANGLTARFTGPNAPDLLYELETSGEDMLCLGPEVGV